jgi:AAA family ATP:ADP antiporter
MKPAGHFLENWFDIRGHEVRRVLLMSTYLLLMIAAYTATKAVRDSLFITKIGPAQLPYVYLLIAGAMGLVSILHSKAIGRMGLPALIRLTSLVAVSNLLLFWVAFRNNSPAWSYVLYVWVSIFGAITASQFWLLATHVFDPREARRVFSWIGVGGILGGVLGGGLTNRFAHWLGTESLLIVCAGMVAATLILLEQVVRHRRLVHATETNSGSSEERTGRAVFRQVRESRHLTTMVVLLSVAVIVEAFIDYEYKLVAKQSIPSKDHLTAFFGSITFYIGILSLLFQLLVTNRVLRRWGVGLGILMLPSGLCAAFLALAVWPALWTAALLQLVDGALSYSIHRSGMELLYLPIPPLTRNSVKGFIDMFVDRAGRAAGAILLLVCTAGLALSIPALSLIAAGLVIAWIAMGIAIKREYLHSFRRALEKKTVEAEAAQLRSVDSVTMRTLLDLLSGNDERQVLYALDLLNNAAPSRWRSHIDRLIQHPSTAVRARTIAALARWKDPSIKEFIHHSDYETARIATASALRLHWSDSTQERELLDDLLQDSSLPVTREAMRTAGIVGYSEAVPLLIARLADKSLRRDSRLALLSFGDSVLPELVRRLSDSEESSRIRVRIPKTLAMTGKQDAADALIQRFHRYGYHFDFAILKALNRMRVNSPHIVIEPDVIRAAITRERQEYDKLKMVNISRTANPPDHAAFSVLFRAVNERLVERRERIFRLLGLIYPAHDIYSVYYNYRAKPELRPAAIEFLDNILDIELKQTLIPVLEEPADRQNSSPISMDAALSILRSGDDAWLDVIIDSAAEAGFSRRDANRAGRSRSQQRAKAGAYGGQYSGHARATAVEEYTVQNSEIALSPIDKVLCLQRVDVFKYATTEMLAYIGSIAHEVSAPGGQSIFTEDEMSEAMYVVVDGRVRLDKSGKEILTVAAGQSFGTWALFDDQPRVMTATALTNVHLLMIRSEDFYDLLSDHDEITPMIFRAVIDRVNRLIGD